MYKPTETDQFIYGTRVIKNNLRSGYDSSFKWTLRKGRWHTAKDWRKDSYCGHGLHFFPYGVGDEDCASITNERIWLFVRARKSEFCYIDDKEKGKAKSLQVLDWGTMSYVNSLCGSIYPDKGVNFATIMDVNKYRKNIKVGNHGVVKLYNSNQYRNLKIIGGYGCTIEVGNYVNIDTGNSSFVKVGKNSTVNAGLGSIVVAGKNTKVGGRARSIIFDLGFELRTISPCSPKAHYINDFGKLIEE